MIFLAAVSPLTLLSVNFIVFAITILIVKTICLLCSKFEDIFDVDHFINYLKDDVRIIRDIPDWFTEKDELFTSIKYVYIFFCSLPLWFNIGM
jgi:hypothetical protein